MNIAIIGASAGVGLQCVERALARGHQVLTLSRSTDSLPKHQNLTSVKGSATNLSDLKPVIAQADAVIVALGTAKSTKATTLYTDFAATLIQAQKELNTKIPFLIVTGFGAGESGKYHGFLMKLVFKFVLKAVYENKTAMEEMISRSSINWEFVRPGLLTSNPLSEQYRVEPSYYQGMKIGSISRSDVADFLVKQAENPTLLKSYPALSNQ